MADPCAALSASVMTKPARITGRPSDVWLSESAVPIPDSTSTLPKRPPAPVTKMMIATMGSAESATELVRFLSQPALRPITR